MTIRIKRSWEEFVENGEKWMEIWTSTQREKDIEKDEMKGKESKQGIVRRGR